MDKARLKRLLVGEFSVKRCIRSAVFIYACIETNLARLDDVHCPVLVLHGLHDRTVPAWHGRALFARAGEPKLCLWVENAGHDDLDWVAKGRYWEAIRRLDQLAGQRISK